MKGDLLIIRRWLESQLQALNQSQRDNIFHTRCYINGKLHSLLLIVKVVPMWLALDWCPWKLSHILGTNFNGLMKMES